ncbi:MAG: CRISPR-associated helicase Cas3' [Nitrospiraceae bacterium]|nr:CRISPR-associated helicase Cas3' [Nitrospiraceae bacterium]
MKFWAKTTTENKPGISVYEHMLNVGYVAHHIAELLPGLLERFQLQSNGIAALAALHDLGKISPGFQRKSPEWLAENNLSDIDRRCRWDVMERDHGGVSQAAIQDFLVKIGISRDSAQYLATVLGAHHGRIKFRPDPRGYRTNPISENNSGIDWNAERLRCAERIWSALHGEDTVYLTDETPAIWWFAGLTSVADWIGSDERFFTPERSQLNDDKDTLAQNALDSIGFSKAEVVPSLSFHDLFHDKDKPNTRWTPNEMQEKTITMINGPGVYVVEAPMGVGKTEAALWAAYKLLVAGKATGIYFALPTQATSNRMHLRMKEFVDRIAPDAHPSRLIHGNSWLMDKTPVLNPSASIYDKDEGDAGTGRDWFSSAKRALIAPFGVGTVDQALLGVVAAKHFFVRHFALAAKVVILDEVHSYDLYTGTLIDELIKTLEGLGCTVIVLSATLSAKRLGQIISLPSDIADNTQLPYPLITGRNEGIDIDPVTAAGPKPRTVKVDFISNERAAEEAIKLAGKGGAVLWVCNTVDAAQTQYRIFKELVRDEFPIIGLLHARFPFWRREKIEDEWMARFGKSGETRCGSILVSTQIVEQSVDLDADLLITELAPTDMLLQRLGRLWRHERPDRQIDAARLCIIKEEKSLTGFRDMKPEEIKKTLGGKAQVYAPYALLRSLEIWEAHPEVTIPSQIRNLIESTYQERGDEPPSWQKLYEDWFGTDSAKRLKAFMSANLWQPALEDIEGQQTRLNEIEMIPLILCRNLSKKQAVFVDDSAAELRGDKFLLSTAQAIHKNLVKVPEYCFDHVMPCESFADYLHGRQTMGIISDDGAVEVLGLKGGISLFYSDEVGLAINGKSGKEDRI